MLVIRDLVKIYPGPVAALAGVSLELPNGMFGLLGPNGAGKSTLMKIVAGLLEPTAGSVTLDGEDVTAKPEHVWDKLGYLPQDFGFYPHLTAKAMLKHMLRLKGIRKPGRVADDLLEKVNLAGVGKRKLSEFSGGMRQRLGIAQAIVGNPRLIIVDEPTAGLDPEERMRFYHLLAELAQDRIVLLSTHIVEDVAVLCPFFAVIREGLLIAQTTPQDAVGALEGTIYQGSVSDDSLGDLKGDFTVTQSLLFGGHNRVRVHSPSGDVPEGFECVTATLEDAYLVLMRSDDPFLHEIKPDTAA
jgi:ABC-2 type transport system ATP-binding protein